MTHGSRFDNRERRDEISRRTGNCSRCRTTQRREATCSRMVWSNERRLTHEHDTRAVGACNARRRGTYHAIAWSNECGHDGRKR